MGDHSPLPPLRRPFVQPHCADDNPMKLMSIAMRPMSAPPFPIERIEEMTRLMGGDGEMNW